MPLRLAEKTDDAPHSAATTVARDEHHKWNLLLNVSVIFHARQLLQKLESLSKCVSYPHQQLGERKSTYKLDSTRAGQWTKSHTLFAPLSICSVGDMKAMNSLTAFLQLRSHRCIHLTFSWNDKMLDGTSPHHRRIKLHVTVMVLW